MLAHSASHVTASVGVLGLIALLASGVAISPVGRSSRKAGHYDSLHDGAFKVIAVGDSLTCGIAPPPCYEPFTHTSSWSRGLPQGTRLQTAEHAWHSRFMFGCAVATLYRLRW